MDDQSKLHCVCPFFFVLFCFVFLGSAKVKSGSLILLKPISEHVTFNKRFNNFFFFFSYIQDTLQFIKLIHVLLDS